MARAVAIAILAVAGCEHVTDVDPYRPAPETPDLPEPRDTGVVDRDARVCGAEAEIPDGAVVLGSADCDRISPELDQIYPQGEDHDGDTDVGEDPAEDLPSRCGFFNWLGGFSVVEDGDDLAITYCDADTEGGVRFAHTTADGDRRVMAPVGGECLATDGAVALTRAGDGWRLFWVRNDDHGAPYGQTVRLDAAGFADPERQRLAFAVAALQAVGGHLLVVDPDRHLSIAPLDADGAPGTATNVAINVRGFDGAPLAGGLGVLACDLDSRLGFTRIDADGRALHEDLSSPCWGHVPLSLATSPDGAWAASWSDADGAALLVRDASGAEVLRARLGDGPAGVAWDGSAWVVASSDGDVLRIGPDGERLGQGVHRPLVGRGSSARAIRVLAGEGRADVLLVGTEILPVGEHAFAFNFLEISAVDTP